MGNCNDKSKKYTPADERDETDRVPYTSYCSLDNAASSRSARFVLFGGSAAVNSASGRLETSGRSRASRVSRVSRRTENLGASNDQLYFSKTKWPVPQFEAAFLPEFKIKGTAIEAEFDFIDVISKGAYGQVYKVRSRNGGEIFALKVLSKAQIIAEDAVDRVKDEVRIQQVVGHHPFVVNASCHWQDKRRLYVGSDFVPGGELYTLVDECGSLPEDAVRILVAEVALAIDFLHNAGIIHRDIKASNILLDDEGHAQLIDFGFAKWLRHGQKTSTICGTPRYIAPEILRGEPYGHAVDWWSLGILMFFLLTTEYPLPPEASSSSGVSEPYSQDTSISVPGRDLIKRLLENEPASRLRSIIGLQRVAFYKNCDFKGYTCRTVSPFDYIAEVRTKKRDSQGRDPDVDDIFPGFSESAPMLPEIV